MADTKEATKSIEITPVTSASASARRRGGGGGSGTGTGGSGSGGGDASLTSNVAEALKLAALQSLIKKWFRVGLSSVAALCAIIGLATAQWSVAWYPPGVASTLQTEIGVGLASNLPSLYVNGSYVSGEIDVFATKEFARVGQVALGFGVLGLILVGFAALAQVMKAVGRTWDESYFIILSCSFIGSLCFFCGATLYGQSIPTFGDRQRLGSSVVIYITAGILSVISAVIGFTEK